MSSLRDWYINLSVTRHSRAGLQVVPSLRDCRGLQGLHLKAAGYSGERIPAIQRRMVDAIQAIAGVASEGSVQYPPLEIPSSWQSLVYTDTTEDLSPSNAAA